MLDVQEVLKPNPGKRSGSSILDNVYIIESDNRLSTLSWLKAHPLVIYAEVIPEEKLLHLPNDPEADPNSGGQNYLAVIQAYEAWDITTGSEDIVIGIVDTGMATDHEDLVNNYFHNPNEVDNGIDDDGNGYIDDILGYDFADNDNDPHAETDITSTLNHGTHVGGVAGATTNNGLGIAGIGYNTKIVPLKGFTTIGLNSFGLWEGVLYAAENGYDVANLSWGNTAGFNQFFQDVIDYCVLEKDMVVIAAAGNTNADLDFYPASYEHVISVGASTNSDTKWSSGTFGDHLDIMAPGVGILSTQKDDTYSSDNGSSHASPMVAGAAALVKSVFSEFNARQIMEQLRATTDDIYDQNPSYPYQLGKGRLNVHQAVTETTAKSLRIHNFSYNNGFGPYAFHGDTITLTFDLANYLAPIADGSISLESDSQFVTILDGSENVGSFDTMQSKSSQTFQIVLDQSTPNETEIDLRFLMSDGTYTDFQNLSFVTEPDRFTFGDENLAINVYGQGSLAFEDKDYTEGTPATFNSVPVLRYSGLMIGTSGTDLSDNVTNTFSIPRTRDDDFTGVDKIRLEKRDSVPMVGTSIFNSMDGNYRVEQTILQGESDSYILIRYRIVNTSGVQLSNVHSGYFADYFLGNQTDNHADWDAGLNALIMYNDAATTFAALSVMADNYTRLALDMQAQNGNSRDIDDDFTDAEKFAYLSGANIDAAGTESIGNDVALMAGQSIGELNPGEGTEFTVVLAMGNNYSELSSALSEAATQFQKLINSPKTKEILQTCFGLDYDLNPIDGEQFEFYRDPMATDLVSSAESLTIPTLSNDTIIYVRNIDPPYEGAIEQVKLFPKNQVANFTSSSDTLYLDESANSVTFSDLSKQPIDWAWDFANGIQSSLQNPTVFFDTPGTYSVTLTVTSNLGCTDSFTKDLVVANRPEMPQLDDFEICLNETVQLTHPEAYSIFNGQDERVTKGSSLTLGPFSTDTTLLVAQWNNGFESLPAEVQVLIDPITAQYAVYPDTLSTETAALFLFAGVNADSYEWRIDGNLESTTDQLTFPVQATLNLSLAVSNTNCSEVISETITFSASPEPEVSAIQVCSGDDAVLRPGNGTYFGFYADSELTGLLHKGTQLRIENINTDQSIFVVGLDDVLPSQPVEVTISASDFDPEILANPESLDLTTGSTVQFSISEDVVIAEWYINDELVETSQSPILLFTTTGEYDIRLEAMDAAGCIQTKNLTFLVFEPVLGVHDESKIQVFPNPTSGQLQIQSDSPLRSLRLLNLAGKLVQTLNPNSESQSLDQANGVYLLEIKTSRHTFIKRIRIQ